MEIIGWIDRHSFDLISAAGIIGGILFSAFSYRAEARTRRVANLISITASYREIWKLFITDQRLARVLKASADTKGLPVTEEERAFVMMVILHLNSAYYANRDDLVVKLEGWRRDVSQFLSLPIPAEVWERVKALQNDDFAAFVESCRNWR